MVWHCAQPWGTIPSNLLQSLGHTIVLILIQWSNFFGYHFVNPVCHAYIGNQSQ